MARTAHEAAAVTRAKPVLEHEVDRGGGTTLRVVIDHEASDHDVLPVPAHYGPAFNANYAQTVAEIRGVPMSEVDLLEEARRTAQRAREEYPAEDGHLVAIEALVPEPDGQTGNWRRVE